MTCLRDSWHALHVEVDLQADSHIQRHTCELGKDHKVRNKWPHRKHQGEQRLEI